MRTLRVLLVAVGVVAVASWGDSPPEPAPSAGAPPASAPSAGAPPAAAAGAEGSRAERSRAEGSRADSSGDPLPAGATARLGTVRLRHSGRVFQMAFSPDGRRLFSVGRDGFLRAWSMPDGRQLWELATPRGQAFCLAVNRDGSLVAIPHQGGLAVIKADTGEIAHHANCGGGVAHLAFSADGKRLIAAEFNKRIAAYAIEPDIARVDLAAWPGTGKFAQFDLSPDGSRVAVAEPSSEAIQIRSAADGKAIATLARPDRTGTPGCKVFSPDGATLAVGGRGIDCSIVLWDIAAKTATRTLTGLTVAPAELHWLPSGTRLLSITDEHLAIWNTATGEPAWQLRDAALGFQCAAVSRDGKLLAVGCLGGQILLWNVANAQPTEHPPFTRSSASYAASVAWWPSGHGVIVAGPTARLWDAASGQLKLEWSRPPAAPAADGDARLELVAVSADGRTLVEAGPANGLAVRALPAVDKPDSAWPSEPPSVVRSFAESLRSPLALSLSADGRWAWVVTEDRTLSVWDTTTGRAEVSVAVSLDMLPVTLSALPDGRTAVGCTAQRVVLWERSPSEGKLSPTVLLAERESDEITTVAVGVTAAGDIAAFGPDMVRIWDRKTRTVQRQFPIDGVVSATGAVSRDGRWAATVGFGNQRILRLWELATGKSITLVGLLPTDVRRLEFSPDGSRLLTVGPEGTALIWATRPTAEPATDDKARGECWAQLLLSPEQAVPAAERLIAGGAASADFVVARLARPESLNARIQALIRALDAEDFQAREDASEELFQLGSIIESAVREALKGQLAPEQRTRLTGLLERFEVKTADGPRRITGQVGGERLRSLRAVAVLERISSPAAVAALEKLAAGNADDLETRHAVDALSRLRR